MILDATTKSLEIKLNAAATTTELPVVASYVDINTTSFAMTAASEVDSITTGTTAVTVVAAPAATTARKIMFLSVSNVDTVAAVVTVRFNNNTTMRILLKYTLAVGDSLFFVDGQGWSVFDANGNLKTAMGGVLPAANFPALTGDVTTPSGSLVTTIGALKVTNTMLAGSIAAAKLIGTDIATVGTITTGVWNAGAVTSSGTITGVTGAFSGVLTVTGNGLHYFNGGSSQRVLIGRTTATANDGLLGISFNGAAVVGTDLIDSSDTAGAIFHSFSKASGTKIGSISRNAGTDAVLYNISSDIRLKNDLGLATDLSGLLALRVHDFTWKSDVSGYKDRGVFAQEAYKAMHRGITPGKTDKDYWQASYSSYVPDLIVGWQQHDAALQAQAARIAALERSNAERN